MVSRQSRRRRVWNPQLVCGMESRQSLDWNQPRGLDGINPKDCMSLGLELCASVSNRLMLKIRISPLWRGMVSEAKSCRWQVFASGVAQSASWQSRAGAGDSQRHATATGAKRKGRQPVLTNLSLRAKLAYLLADLMVCIPQAEPQSMPSAALRATVCLARLTQAQDKQKEPTKNRPLLRSAFCWLPLLGSNQRQPD